MTYAYKQDTQKQANFLLFVIITFMVVFLYWASHATVDEITHGTGRVIPSSQVQIVQNLVGGIVKNILVNENEIVEKGQMLLLIDDTGFASHFEENKEHYYSLQAKMARLNAEVLGEGPEFSAECLMKGQKYVVNETKLYYAKQDEVDSTITIFKQKTRRKQEEIDGLKKSKDKLITGMALLEKEISMTAPLVKSRIVSEVDMLKLKRELNDIKREVDAVDFSIIFARGEKEEFYDRIQEYINTFKRKNIEELSILKDEYARVSAVMKASIDRVDRTMLRSPVRGTIKRILVNTVGGVVRPGMDLVEIIPLEDTLKIEAEVKPQDIAFLRPDQHALVKISAYDFAIYGGLDAKLECISVDSMRNEKDELIYKILVRTQKNYLGRAENPLPIIAGIVADVNIVTGKKTVLDYILKPILKARDSALRER
ncbi:MAG: adhesin transport system membrane fusion protein [Alphaproteobacteria bacterium]|jgi:adhesin transport system membrane fusion protein